VTRIWSWLGLNLGKRAGVVSIVGLLVTLTLGLGITQLEFATGQDSYLNKDDEIYVDNLAYQDLFGGQAVVSLYTMDEGHDVVDLFTPDNIERFRAQEERLREVDGVLAAISPVTALEFTHNMVSSPDGNPASSVAGGILLRATQRETDEAAIQARTEASIATLERINAIPVEQRTIENPDWVRFLIFDNDGEIRKSLRGLFPDDTHVQAIVRLGGNQSLDVESAAFDEVIAITTGDDLDNATMITTGVVELLQELNDYLQGGMLTLGAIAVAIMVVILLVLFDVRWRLLPLAVVLIGVVWAFGLAGYLGIPLSIVTIAGLPVMLGVGIDYAIQMHSRIEEEVIIDRAAHPIQETSRNLGPALLVVTFDAVFAFAALRFAQVPMIRHFGVLVSVGIAAICLCSIIMPLSILGIREYRSPTKGRDFREGRLGKLVVWMGSLPATSGLILVVASVVIFFGGIAVEDDLVLETDPEQWVNQDSDVIRKLNVLKSETGSSSEMGMFIQSDDVFSDETVAFVQDFINDEMARYPDDLLTATSLVSTVGFLMEVPGATLLPPTGEDVEAAYEVAPHDVQLSTVNPEAGALNLIFRTGPSSLEQRAVVVNDITDRIDPPEGIRATPSGLAVVGVGLLENLEANRTGLTYLAVAFVGIFLAFRLRSVVRSLLSLVPVLIAVGTASLVAWAFSLKLSPMTAVGGPLVVAACTEFTSLILLRYLEERRRGLEPRAAVDVTASRTGRAFIVSALTAIAGVAVIAFSSLPLLQDFGMIVAMNVAVALLSALVFLPPMLVWADQRGWVSKGMLGDRHDQPEGGDDGHEPAAVADAPAGPGAVPADTPRDP
jgi:hydrophobe/amphiphile efflux-3 (HAE3) family protein